MTSPEMKVKFFEQEENPLPDGGSVRVITTGDGFDLRLGLWPVPGFKISIGDVPGDPAPGEEAPSGAGDESPQDIVPGNNVLGDEPSGTAPANPQETAPDAESATAAQPDSNEASSAGDDGDTPRSDPLATANVAPEDDETAHSSPAFGESDGETETGTNEPGSANAKAKTQSADETGSDRIESAEPDAPDESEHPVGLAESEENPETDDPDLPNSTSGAGDTGSDLDPAQQSASQPDLNDEKTVPAVSLNRIITGDVVGETKIEDPVPAALPVDQSPGEEGPVPLTSQDKAGEQAPADPSELAEPDKSEGSAAAGTSRPAEPVSPIEQAITMSGTIIVLNGRSEFIEKYGEVIRELIDRGFCVAALDWRGQGGSERLIKRRPRKGHIDDMDSYVEDLTTLLDFLETTNCPKPYYCLAHSTGGQVLLRAAPIVSARISRAVTTAPFLDLASYRTPKPAVYAFAATMTYAGFGEMYAPGAGRNPPSDDPFEGNAYSSDAHRYQRTAKLVDTYEELATGGPTISWIYAALKSADELFEPDFLSNFTLPVLMLSASEDRVVSTQAVEDFANLARTVSHLSIPGSRHEILMERDEIRSQFWAAFDAFIPGDD